MKNQENFILFFLIILILTNDNNLGAKTQNNIFQTNKVNQETKNI
jgi:hypothetical protein